MSDKNDRNKVNIDRRKIPTGVKLIHDPFLNKGTAFNGYLEASWSFATTCPFNGCTGNARSRELVGKNNGYREIPLFDFSSGREQGAILQGSPGQHC